MIHPLALNAAAKERLVKGGLIRFAPPASKARVAAPKQAPKPPPTEAELAARAQKLRAAGALGGAPLSCTNAALLREAWHRIVVNREPCRTTERLLGVTKGVLLYHIRGTSSRSVGPSRAMRAALAEVKNETQGNRKRAA